MAQVVLARRGDACFCFRTGRLCALAPLAAIWAGVDIVNSSEMEKAPMSGVTATSALLV